MGVFAGVQQGAIFDKVGGQLPFAQGWAPSPLLSVEITFLCHGLNATSNLKLEGGKENLQFEDTVQSRRDNFQIGRRVELVHTLSVGCSRCH